MLAKNPEDSSSPIFPSSVAEKFPIYSRLIYSVVIMPWHDNSMTICCIKTKLPFDTCLLIIFAPKIRKAKTYCSISSNSFSSYKTNPLVYTNTKLTPPKNGCFVRLKSNQIRIISSRETKFKGKLTKASLDTAWIFSYI